MLSKVCYEGLVKRVVYGRSWIELHSINPAYPVQRFDGEELLNMQIVGAEIQFVINQPKYVRIVVLRSVNILIKPKCN